MQHMDLRHYFVLIVPIDAQAQEDESYDRESSEQKLEFVFETHELKSLLKRNVLHHINVEADIFIDSHEDDYIYDLVVLEEIANDLADMWPNVAAISKIVEAFQSAVKFGTCVHLNAYSADIYAAE